MKTTARFLSYYGAYLGHRNFVSIAWRAINATVASATIAAGGES